MKTWAAAALILTALGAPSVVAAASVTVGFTQYGSGQVGTALMARDGFLGGATTAGEDFEGFISCPDSACASGTIRTGVGDFTGLGGAISNGGSQVAPKDKIVVRDNTPNPFGRFNVTQGGANWLDSNDREGIKWTVLTPGSTYLSKIAFLLTDLDDVGNVLFTITVKGTDLKAAIVPRTLANGKIGDGKLHLVTMQFDGPTDNVVIKMVNGTGDGFGIDGIRLAAVPLPAGGVLLLAGLGGLAMLRRRRAA
jgi:hypothetical protein